LASVVVVPKMLAVEYTGDNKQEILDALNNHVEWAVDMGTEDGYWHAGSQFSQHVALKPGYRLLYTSGDGEFGTYRALSAHDYENQFAEHNPA